MSRVWDENLNPYEVLEVEQGVDATEAEIKKAYRRLARLKHPDKTTEARAEDFHLIQSAYEILTDADARAAYDAVITYTECKFKQLENGNFFSCRARQLHEERWRKQSEKRRRMREDLEQKEKAWTEERTTEAVARAALHKELERLRKKLETQHQSKTQPTPVSQPSSTHDTSCMIKIKWTDERTSWNEEKLRTVLREWVEVKTVALRCRRDHLYSAVVELSSARDVEMLTARQQALVQQTCQETTSADMALLMFTLHPLRRETCGSTAAPARSSSTPLSEAEVLAKMRRVAGKR